MKSSKYWIGLSLLLSLTIGCNKKLDVTPQNSLTPDQIKTSADVKALLFGAYSGLQGPGAFGESLILAPDLIASDSQLIFSGTFQDYQQVANKAARSTNGIAQNLWGVAYNVISLSNTVLDKIGLVDSVDRNSVRGEALFIRGIAYFELTGLFAKPYSDGNAATNPGVPIVLKPTYSYDSSKNSPDKPTRASVALTYTQILADLQTAISYLPEYNDDYRADAYSARAFLSRVYLSMGRFADAAAQADTVIKNGGFNLTSTFDKTFNTDGNSTEDIFAIQQSAQSNAGTADAGLSTFYIPTLSGRGDAMVDPLFYDIFDDSTDFRATFVVSGSGIAGNTGDFSSKWGEFFKTIPVVRLAEMYLTRGEANLMAGGVTGDDPLDDINIVRARAGIQTPMTTVAPADFIEERFRELSFEGDRFWTLKRWKLNFGIFDFDNDKLILPIPQIDIDANPNLAQNKGY